MKYKYLSVGLCLLVTFFAGCKKYSADPIEGGKELELTATEQQKAGADNTFTLKLFRSVAAANTANANLFISPLSVSFAMGMTNNGANGQTLIAINTTMNFNGFSQDAVNSYYNKLITQLPAVDAKTTINIANSIWYNNRYTVLPQFLQTNNTSYQAYIQPADFASAATPGLMNQWVSDKTNGKIPSIIDKIPSDAVMYLINTIYFKSSWQESFLTQAARKSKRSLYRALPAYRRILCRACWITTAILTMRYMFLNCPTAITNSVWCLLCRWELLPCKVLPVKLIR